MIRHALSLLYLHLCSISSSHHTYLSEARWGQTSLTDVVQIPNGNQIRAATCRQMVELAVGSGAVASHCFPIHVADLTKPPVSVS